MKQWPWAHCSLMMGTWRFSDEYIKVQCTFMFYLKLSKKLQDGHLMKIMCENMRKRNA